MPTTTTDGFYKFFELSIWNPSLLHILREDMLISFTWSIFQETLWEEEFNSKVKSKSAPVGNAQPVRFATPIVASKSAKPTPYWVQEPEDTSKFKPVKFGGELEVSSVFHRTSYVPSRVELQTCLSAGWKVPSSMAPGWRWNGSERLVNPWFLSGQLAA